MKWGYIWARKLESERSKSLAVSISLQSKAIRSYFRVRGTGSIPQVPGDRAEVGQNYDGRKAVSASPSVLRLSGAIFRAISSKVTVQKVLLCPFNCKLRPSEVSLASLGIENIRKAITSYFRVPETGKYPPSSAKSRRSWSE